MDRNIFETFVRRSADLLDRRSLFGGASAALLAVTGAPRATEAKKHNHKHHKNTNTKACKQRIKECRKDFLPGCEQTIDPPECEEIVNNCCKKACESKDKALECLADNL
jgi:hypothetical protein